MQVLKATNKSIYCWYSTFTSKVSTFQTLKRFQIFGIHAFLLVNPIFSFTPLLPSSLKVPVHVLPLSPTRTWYCAAVSFHNQYCSQYCSQYCNIMSDDTINHNNKEQRWFSNYSRKRISALFATSSSKTSTTTPTNMNSTQNVNDNENENNRDYSTRNRSKELKRLAKTMEVDVGKVKEMLQRQLPKLISNSEKAAYVNWLLGNNNDNNNNDSDDHNRKNVGAEVGAGAGAGAAIGKNSNSRKRSDSHLNNHAPITSLDNNIGYSNNEKKNKNRLEPQKKIKTKQNNKQVEKVNLENNNQQVQTIPTSSFSESSSKPNSNLHTSTRFQDLQLHHLTKKSIANVLKHEYMSEIQSKTYAAAATGTDVLGRARTGTGKTLAFLIPALERILNSNEYVPGKNIGILVISPTRELATQIGTQAEQLLTYHKNLSCQVMYGGTKMTRDVNSLNKGLPTILISTPGRINDHLENTVLSNGKKFGYDIMRDTRLLILDEADRLLDMGFQREIKKIMTYLPKKERRQTLLFSATVPQELKQIMFDNMKQDFVEVDCIGGDGNSEFANEEHTNILVKQTHVVLPSLDRYVSSVVEIVKHFMKGDEYKLVVFFPTARLVGFFAEFFKLGLGIDVIEIHSRKSQGFRNRASDDFRNAKKGVLFTSDVSARGVDYPDVSGVIQFGLPESRDQYIHRLGRTGRAGKDGIGLLVLAPFESKFITELKDLDIPVDNEISELLHNPLDENIANDLKAVFNRIRSGDAVLTLSAQQAYQAFIGYYRGNIKRTSVRNTEQLVDIANEYSRLMGLKEVPGLTKKVLGKMGLKNLPNVRIVDESEVRKKGRGIAGGNGPRRNARGRR